MKINILAMLLIVMLSCNSDKETNDDVSDDDPTTIDETQACNHFEFNNEVGCDGKAYPDPNYSKYVLPYPTDSIYYTGLTNCSGSYHAEGKPDRYAFDFNMDEGTNFYAARGGVVVYVANNQPSGGGGGGNACVISHLDNTYGIYLHSPENGISVSVGENVSQGDLLGVTGRSGLAGYPHLHFIVVQDGYQWPYDPIPITFRNVMPSDVILKSFNQYKACAY